MQIKPYNKEVKKSHYTDEELVALFINTGHNYYFGLLYVKCSVRVYRQCFMLVKDQSLAEDLTHDIFLKIMSSIKSFRGESRFSTWLSHVTYNHCMDFFYLMKRKSEVSMDERIEIADDVDLNYFGWNDPNDIMKLENALADLPAPELGLLLMRYKDNLSIPDMAKIFNVTVSAVKMRLLRSRTKLRIACSA